MMTKQEAIDFCKNNPEAAADIILMVEKLEARIKELEARLGLNSTNSSKPPSSDNKLTKNKKRQPSNSNKKRGAQKGHKGNTLSFSSTPDHIKEISPSTCACCHHSLQTAKRLNVDKRQVFDLPKITIEVTEYQSYTKHCPYCNKANKLPFPKGVNASVGYGDNLKSFINYCNTHQMLPYMRISELVEDLTTHKISVGTIHNFLSSHYNALEGYETAIKQRLLEEALLHSDETGINIQGKLHWIHVASSSTLTYYTLHQKRGKEAMEAMGILPNYTGIVVHDHWSSYNSYRSCAHSFCNAHILRELQAVIEHEDLPWAKDMKRWLLQTHKAVIRAKKEQKAQLDPFQVNAFTKGYETITKSAQCCYDPPPKRERGQRGRIKQKKGKNLLDRLVKYQEETLRFMHDFRVSFTNNQAERDLRMVRVKEKVSGCFASFNGGEMFARIRGYISTLKKNKVPVLQGLRDALKGEAYVPAWEGC